MKDPAPKKAYFIFHCALISNGDNFFKSDDDLEKCIRNCHIIQLRYRNLSFDSNEQEFQKYASASKRDVKSVETIFLCSFFVLYA